MVFAFRKPRISVDELASKLCALFGFFAKAFINPEEVLNDLKYAGTDASSFLVTKDLKDAGIDEPLSDRALTEYFIFGLFIVSWSVSAALFGKKTALQPTPPSPLALIDPAFSLDYSVMFGRKMVLRDKILGSFYEKINTAMRTAKTQHDLTEMSEPILLRHAEYYRAMRIPRGAGLYFLGAAVCSHVSGKSPADPVMASRFADIFAFWAKLFHDLVRKFRIIG